MILFITIVFNDLKIVKRYRRKSIKIITNSKISRDVFDERFLKKIVHIKFHKFIQLFHERNQCNKLITLLLQYAKNAYENIKIIKTLFIEYHDL